MTGGRISPLHRASAPVERAFLPAALEIVETPPSPTARYTGWAICLFLVTALAWSWFGHVDMIAAASGKAAPAGRTKQIQAFETGVVRKILVEDGDRVTAGQPLILLDQTLAGADRDRFADQFMRARLDVARLTALLAEAEGRPLKEAFAGIEAPEDSLREARGRFAADRANRQARLAGADRDIAAKRSERAGLDAQLAKVDASLPMTAERVRIRKYTFEKGIGSKLDYLNAAQQQSELENDRKVTAEKAVATEAALQAAIADRARISAETERDWRSELQKALRDRAEAQSELAKAERRTGLTSVTAPIDGVAQDLAVHTEGGVVQAGQQLLRVAPTDGALVIEAVVENKDAGFVRVGQEAEIKVEAFPFTRYGFLHGKVASIARDATPDPEEQQARGATLDHGPNELRRSQGLVYVARITVDDATLDVDGVSTRLEPGMAITAEIKTGRRRVLDYLLSPIAQRTHEALRER
ncbi:hypothetical protein CCR94_01545 [Rhodoblastus sphagnicola]|uniref:Membrane fusion protein (MFP) family protein n=1 Tax=Rhodoblastus sphagnicola TaxID=333368 RepID=A0A2S6NG41_9HYPH|nr:HlyD family type I secretion periplasmic adaptor subunit [Rhodoblastus sphagnicola]MBB4199472.1 HlyD family type I secretion membrane fusion protein [Rhodoblastus sphagnicola]PPQ33560.1 hypothetical protein CCR94_01545 [Rhodoblastus sphagnicola]